MKTTSKNTKSVKKQISKSGLKVRPEQHSSAAAETQTGDSSTVEPAPAPAVPPSTPAAPKGIRPYVNFAERDRNRTLPKERILAILARWMPRQYELAEVVGNWIWITFPEAPSEHVRAELSQLGFHWNNTRQVWQHPCGETLPRGTEEPREKYTTYFAADRIAA